MQQPKFTPWGDRLLVKPDETAGQTESGLFIVTSEQAIQGTIISASLESGKQTGTKVLYGKYAGTDISIGGQDYKIMRVGDIFGNL